MRPLTAFKPNSRERSKGLIMSNIRQIIKIALLLVQGIFDAVKKSMDFTRLEDKICKLNQEAAGMLLVHALEALDERLLAKGEKGLEVICKKECTLVAGVGEITFKRHYSKDKKGDYSFLSDESLGPRPRMRMSKRMQCLALELATKMFFRRAAKILSYITLAVSHMGV